MEKLMPATFNQIRCYCICRNLKGLCPEIKDEVIEKIYNFLIQNEKYKVLISIDGMISFVNEEGRAVDALSARYLTVPSILTLSASMYRITDTGSSSSYRSYDRNHHTNNNNNNNNNNNG